MRMELFWFPGHCLRGRMKLRKSSNTPKTQMQHDDAEKDKSDNDQQHKTNSVPFPQDPAANDPEDEPPQPQGRPQCTAMYQGNYKGMMAAAAIFDKEDVDKIFPEGVESGVGEVSVYLYELPLDVAALGHSDSDPNTFKEALHGPNAKEWQEAPDYEINQLQKLGTWVVEDLPTGQTAIPCSEVMRVKRGPDGKVQSYRVRIVAGGHRQVEGVNYTETFSAATKMPTVRVVLANAAHQDWEIEHVDVKSAYLNAPLKETIYMKVPRRVLKPGEEGKVLRLLKGLYGLKQAGRGRYMEMMRVFIKELGFERSAIDHLVYYCHKGGGTHDRSCGYR